MREVSVDRRHLEYILKFQMFLICVDETECCWKLHFRSDRL